MVREACFATSLAILASKSWGRSRSWSWSRSRDRGRKRGGRLGWSAARNGAGRTEERGRKEKWKEEGGHSATAEGWWSRRPGRMTEESPSGQRTGGTPRPRRNHKDGRIVSSYGLWRSGVQEERRRDQSGGRQTAVGEYKMEAEADTSQRVVTRVFQLWKDVSDHICQLGNYVQGVFFNWPPPKKLRVQNPFISSGT